MSLDNVCALFLQTTLVMHYHKASRMFTFYAFIFYVDFKTKDFAHSIQLSLR